MSVPFEVPINRFVGNGINTNFFYTFFIEDEADIDVYVDEALLSLTGDYTVDTVGDGGSITFVVAPPNESAVTFVRNTPPIRTVNYAPFGPLNHTDLNEDFDRLTRQDQDYSEALAETLRVGPYDTPANLIIPIVSNRAGKVLSFDGSGNVTVGQLSTILSGEGAPIGGVNGDIYIDTLTWDIYRNEGGTWILIGNIQGGVGATGPTGNGVSTAYIDINGHLIIVLTDTSIVDAGSVIGPIGPAGADGADGATGATGAAGPGVAIGGTAGQLLAKVDAADFDTHWINPPSTLVTLTGDVSGSGTGTVPTTIADSGITAGTYNQLTLNRKGIATGGTFVNIGGEVYIESPSNKTYPVLSSSPRGMVINSIWAKTSSGTLTVAVKINGTNVTGLSAVSVTSTGASTTATAAKTVNIGDRITVVVSSVATAVDLEITINAS